MNYKKLTISSLLFLNTFSTQAISFTANVDENNISQAGQRLAEELSKIKLSHTHQVTYETTELLAKIGEHLREHPIRHELHLEQKSIKAVAYILLVLTGSCGVAVSTYQQSWGMLAVNLGLIASAIKGLHNLTSPQQK